MKELSIEEKAKRYDEALERAKKAIKYPDIPCFARVDEIFPELKESEGGKNKRISKEITQFVKQNNGWNREWLAWLEKQGEPSKLSEEDQNRFAKGVLSSCALSFINYLDAHKYEGKMCVSNGECEDIENAFHNAMWDRLHRYYCKYIEKQTNTKVKDFSENREDLSEFYKQVCHMAASLLNKEYDYTMETIEWYAYKLLEYAKKELEKQDEQSQGKSAVEAAKEEKVDNSNKVEPKFKTDDWIVQNGLGTYKIVEVCEFWYEVVSYIDEIRYSIGFDKENDCHLWTIQDAKDGDVLATEDKNFVTPFVAIYKSLDDTIYNGLRDNTTFNSRCFIGFNGNFYIGEEGHAIEDIHPATKEQRNLLFQKMKEAGYEWDAEKKELKKAEQKHAWSEEDKRKLNRIYSILREAADTHAFSTSCRLIGDKECVELQDFLKSIVLQNTWKPSDEQMKALDDFIYAKYPNIEKYGATVKSLYQDLKKLKVKQ